MSSSNAVGDVRNAAEAMLDSLSGTSSAARVTQFATLAQQLAPRTVIDDASLGTGGALRQAINGYYNPQPPRPSNVNIQSYDGSGNPLSTSNYRLSNSSIQYTNWDAWLDQAAQTTPELVVYVTDGDPTAFDFNHPGDPFDAGPPPDVAVNTDRSTEAAQVTLDRAVEEANRIKSNGTRMLTIGVGSALNNAASQQRLVQISGPQIVRDSDIDDITSLNQVDVALVRNFEDLAQLMRSVVLQLCSPSLTVRKLAQSADDATYAPASGWDVTVAPRVPGGNGFTWILPDTTPATSKTQATDAEGFAGFQWEPDPPEEDSAASVAEDLRPGFTAGRPGAGNDYRCELRNEDGNVRTVTGDFADPDDPSFDLDPIGQEIVTCSMYNSFDYEPAIAVTKVNAPTEVRGDLDPPATVTSTYRVTNPGNTPLSNVTVSDDRCGPVTPVPATGTNQGDTDGDGRLDVGETWTFTCDRTISTTTRATAPTNIVNTATAQGNDPAGTVVTDQATDDVDIFTPAIDLTKLVDGEKSVTVVSGTEVTYTYAVANTGNTPLAEPVLDDDTPPCEQPTRGADDPGNDDDVLDVGETWTYSCTASPTSAVVNTATVSATPLNPLDGNRPFAGRNPDVTDTDTASVTTTTPDLVLEKSVDHDVVFPGTDVTYTYTATNTGTSDLRNDTGDPGWVADNHCAPVTYVSGDDGDGLLNPQETWRFSCSAAISRTTLNIATIVAQPVSAAGNPVGTPLTRHDVALVRVVTPGIAVTKTALVPVVLDPDADPVSGPDVPTPRPAEYAYEVTNTGDVPLTDVSLTDDRCDSPALQSGDSDGDGDLDADEVWHYTCTAPLEKEQGTSTTPGGTATVTNLATASGTPYLPDDPTQTGPEQTDTDTAQVDVIQPGLTLTKTASADAVLAGTDVTYTVEVANTGDAALDVTGLSDDSCSPLEYVAGDANGNGLLDGVDSGAPETWRYRCTRAVGLPTPPATADVNTATVTALDPLGNAYTDEDSATVRVIDPAIHLTKAVSATLVPAGTSVDYEFLVTNSGTSPVAADDVLDSVTLTDASSPANPGCRNPVLVAKEGGNDDDLLDRVPAETWRYACSGTITDPTTDVAVVRADGGSTIGESVPVFDVADAFVDTFHPGIAVAKSADPTVLTGSGEVTYTYRVHNTGDVPLAGVAERITDDTCSPVDYVSGDTDGDGLLDTPRSRFEDSLDETWVFTCTTTLDRTTTNTVAVEGTPTDPGGTELCAGGAGRTAQPCDVSDEDQAVVRVVEPGAIVVSKHTSPASTATFGFTLDDTGFTLGDGDSRTFGDLTPGRYHIAEESTSGWRLRDLTCQDPTGDTVVDESAGTATVHVAAGETVRCRFTNVVRGVGPGEETNPGGGQTESAGGALPGTGASEWLGPALWLGLVLLASGGTILYAARRRRPV